MIQCKLLKPFLVMFALCTLCLMSAIVSIAETRPEVTEIEDKSSLVLNPIIGTLPDQNPLPIVETIGPALARADTPEQHHHKIKGHQ